MTEETDLGLITIGGVADLLGVKVDTARKYAREVYAEGNPDAQAPFFPHPNKQGLYRTSQIQRWMKARKGPGGGKGAVQFRGLYECEQCGNGVRRRWRDLFTDEYLCKPCHRMQARARGERARDYVLRVLRSGHPVGAGQVDDPAAFEHLQSCPSVEVAVDVQPVDVEGVEAVRFDTLVRCRHRRCEWSWTESVSGVRDVLGLPDEEQE